MTKLSPYLMSIALAVGALTACEGTSRGGDAGDGAGAMGGTAGSGNSGSGGNGGSSGASGGSGGASGSGSGGDSGSGGAGAGGVGGSGGQGGMPMDMDASADAMTDAEQDAGPLPASCSGGGYLICEDFEDTAVGAVPDGWSKFGDPVGVADDQAASGTKSLKMSQSDDGRRIVYDASSLPTTHWGRIRYRVATPVPTLDSWLHSTLVSFSGQSPVDNVDLEMRVVDTVKQPANIGSAHQFLYNVQRFNMNEFSEEGPYDWSFDAQWHCVEWYVSSATQAYRFFFDGEEVEQMAFENGAGNYTNSEIPSAFGELRVGWVNYQSAPPGFTAWIDDVAIAAQRVTCAE